MLQRAAPGRLRRRPLTALDSDLVVESTGVGELGGKRKHHSETCDGDVGG